MITNKLKMFIIVYGFILASFCFAVVAWASIFYVQATLIRANSGANPLIIAGPGALYLLAAALVFRISLAFVHSHIKFGRAAMWLLIATLFTLFPGSYPVFKGYYVSLFFVVITLCTYLLWEVERRQLE